MMAAAVQKAKILMGCDTSPVEAAVPAVEKEGRNAAGQPRKTKAACPPAAPGKGQPEVAKKPRRGGGGAAAVLAASPPAPPRLSPPQPPQEQETRKRGRPRKQDAILVTHHNGAAVATAPGSNSDDEHGPMSEAQGSSVELATSEGKGGSERPMPQVKALGQRPRRVKLAL